MIILPIGHERGFVRRLPWVTITIAVLCLLLQVRASVVAIQTGEAADKHGWITRV